MLERPIWWNYVEFYPMSDEEDYDGFHDGGIKGISEDAPENMKKAYAAYTQEQEEAESRGMRL